MYAEDISYWDQAFIVVTFTLTVLGAFYFGCAVKEQEIKEDQERRDLEDAAHRAAVDGRQGYRKTDITV